MIRYTSVVFSCSALVSLGASCSADPLQTGTAPEKPVQIEVYSMKVTITAGGKSFTAEIEDSETGKAFMGKLPLTLEMTELNGNEKYCYGVALPRNDKHYDRIEAGDLMLYSGDCIVLFYGSAGGYNYTRIGKVADVNGLADALGNSGITVKFEKQ